MTRTVYTTFSSYSTMGVYLYGLLDGISYYQTSTWHDISSSWLIFQDGYMHTMQEDYNNKKYCSTLLWTCVETIWPSNNHYIWHRCYICQHLLEKSLATTRHETFFVEILPSVDIQTAESCKSLSRTTASHVQPQALLNMGLHPFIHTA